MQRMENLIDHALGVAEHVVVPEAHDAVASKAQPSLARWTFRCVLAAIDFDDELGRGTKEIDDVTAERLLTAEAEPVELLAPQPRPQAKLGIGWCGTQFTGDR